MLRKVSFSLLLLASTAAFAATDASGVEDVLKAKATGVSEEQLDETAAKMMAEEAPAKPSAEAQAKATVATTTKTESAAKPLAEDQIPVLKSEKASKQTAGSNWFRLIGSAAFVLLVTGVMIFVVKKSAKQKNVGGKKAKIEMIHQHFLGPKKSVALIQVAGEAILIGVTDHNINMIKPVALIDDELEGQPQDFNGFLEDDFTVEQLTAQKSRTRTL